MPKRIRLRALTTEEEVEVKHLAASRKEPIRLVQRARVITAMVEDADLTATEAGLQAGFKSSAVGVLWVKRFNESGLVGLEDCPRAGRKPVHSQAVRSALISLALQKPPHWDTLLSYGPWSGCSVPSRNARVSTCPIRRSEPGWQKKASSGNGNRAAQILQN